MTGLLDGLMDDPGRVVLPFWACLEHTGLAEGHLRRCGGHAFLRPRIFVVNAKDAPVVARTGGDDVHESDLLWRFYDGGLWTPLQVGTVRKASLEHARATGRSTLWNCHAPFDAFRIRHALFGIPDAWDGRPTFGSDKFTTFAIPYGFQVDVGFPAKIDEAERTAERNLILIGDGVWRRCAEPVIEISIKAGAYLSARTATSEASLASPLTTRFRIDQPEAALAFRSKVKSPAPPYQIVRTSIFDPRPFTRDDATDPVREAIANVLSTAKTVHCGRLPIDAIAALRDLAALTVCDAHSAARGTAFLFGLGQALDLDMAAPITAQAEIKSEAYSTSRAELLTQALLLPLRRLPPPAGEDVGVDELEDFSV